MPLQTTQQQKGAPLRGGQRAYARIQREGASAPPAPTPRKYKSKNLAVDGGVGPAFVPECRAVRDRTEKPPDELGAMPPAPVYPKCVYGHSATGLQVLNPAFISFTAAFFPRRARLLHVHFFARQSMYVCRARLRDNSPARLPLLCTYRLHVCPHVGYVRTVRIRVGLSHSRLAERYTGENKQSCHQPPFRLRILSPNRRKLSGNDSVTV